jgi:hypothetical protein
MKQVHLLSSLVGIVLATRWGSSSSPVSLVAFIQLQSADALTFSFFPSTGRRRLRPARSTMSVMQSSSVPVSAQHISFLSKSDPSTFSSKTRTISATSCTESCCALNFPPSTTPSWSPDREQQLQHEVVCPVCETCESGNPLAFLPALLQYLLIFVLIR